MLCDLWWIYLLTALLILIKCSQTTLMKITFFEKVERSLSHPVFIGNGHDS